MLSVLSCCCFSDVTLSDSNANSLGVGIDDCFLLDIVANPGDTNLDGVINVQDIVILINFILGFSNPNEQEFINSDINEDGIVNVLDVIIIVNNILGVVLLLENDTNSCNVNFNQLENSLILTINSETNFSGVQLMINNQENLNITLKDNSHITMKDNFISKKENIGSLDGFFQSVEESIELYENTPNKIRKKRFKKNSKRLINYYSKFGFRFYDTKYMTLDLNYIKVSKNYN